MSYYKGTKVKFNYDDNQTNISFQLPLQYMWDNMSEDDLYDFAKVMVHSGTMVKPLIDALKYPDYTSEQSKELKEQLISELDEIKNSYVQDITAKNNYTWWSIGRGLQAFLSAVYPDRKFDYSASTEKERFYIIDKSKSDRPKNELVINLWSMTASVDDSPSNNMDFERWIRDLANVIQSQRKSYENYSKICEEKWNLEKECRRLKELLKENNIEYEVKAT